MRQRIVKLVLLGAAGAATAAAGGAVPRRLGAVTVEARVVPPLADLALVPGVARCTSDGRCAVTDEHGTHSGTPLALSP